MLSPASTAEVVEIVRLCAEHRVPIVPQGGNSSMVAGATPSDDGRALLLSMRRMNGIRSISPTGNSAVCEAGVILSALHDAAGAVGTPVPLSLGAKGTATVGGLISTNAGGTQVLRFGTMRSLVQGIEAVLPDGSLFTSLAPLKKDNRGYDIRQLLIGAEGTLGIVTAANLKLIDAVGSRAVAWVGLGSPEKALELLRLLESAMGEAIESFELVPKVAHNLVLAHVPGTRAPLAGDHAWHVLVEATAPMVAPSPEKALGRALMAAMETSVVEDASIAASEAQAEAFWRIRESISEAGAEGTAGRKSTTFVEVASMPRFMTEAAAAVEWPLRGHAGDRLRALGDGNVPLHRRARSRRRGADWLKGEGLAVTSFVTTLSSRAGGSIRRSTASAIAACGASARWRSGRVSARCER
jgi:FAD/FMN-containing dehydrogenase